MIVLALALLFSPLALVWLALLSVVVPSAPTIQQVVVDVSTFGNMPSALMTAAGALAAGITQYAKFAGLPDGYGPVFVLATAIVIVALYALGESMNLHPIGSPLGWLFDVANITFVAGGAYGFLRANSPGAVTTTRNPPPGALQAPTTKIGDDA